MNRDLGVWTSEDCALVLIDYQAELLEAIRSETGADLVELHARWLAKTAKAFDMPIVLSSVGVENGIFSPTQPAILAELPDVEPIDRSTMNAFENQAFRDAVAATGRKRLIIGGLHTEVCLALATEEALKSGYDAQFVTDAVGGRSQVAHRTAIERLSHAGAVPNTALAVVMELFRDWAGPLGDAGREVTAWYLAEAPKLPGEVVGIAPAEMVRWLGQVAAEMARRLEGKACVITGTGGSVGRASALAVSRRPYQRAFWTVAFAFLAVMAFAGVPSPLYGLYRARDHFSLFMVTVIYAVYAVGVIGALLLAGHVSDWYGRRPVLLPALGIAIASALVFVASKSLAGLLTARVINGISVGIVASTATAYLAELHAAGRPGATPRRAQLTASAVNVGGLGVGALVAGCLAQWVAHPLTVPYVVFLAALVLGAIGVAMAPETREGPKPRPHYRPQRLSVPGDERSRFFAAALSAFMAFATVGLFSGLAGVFLSATLHQPSHALAGAVLCAMFSAGVGAQFLSVSWPFARDFEVGMGAMVIGLGLAVLAVWVRPPSLALFIAGGVLIGGGAGAIFKGAIGTVMGISSPDRIAESVAAVLLSAFVGLSLPVVGAGVTLACHVSPKVTILGFAIAVSVGIVASALKLAGGPPAQAPAPGWR